MAPTTYTFDKLMETIAERDLDVYERQATVAMPAHERSALGRARVLRLAREQRSRNAQDPVWSQSHATREDAAEVAAAWALTEESSRGVHDAILANEAANLHFERVRSEQSVPYAALTPEDRGRLAEAQALVTRASAELAEAVRVRDVAYARANEVERDVNERVQRRFVAAVMRSNRLAEAQAQRERDEAARRPDPRPAALAAALDALRARMTGKVTVAR